MTVAHPADLAEAPIIELRQYTLHPGRRADLAEVFEEHFVTGQEAAGITLGGLFEDEDADDRFVWLRGFADLDQRTDALETFYGGPVWRAHGPRANATMIDSDDVYLLQPTDPRRPAASAVAPGPGPREDRVLAGICPLDGDPDRERRWVTEAAAILEAELAVRVAMWRSHPGPNGFPALPVNDEQVLVWQASFPSEREREAALGRLAASPDWTAVFAPGIGRLLRLRPLASSRHPAPESALRPVPE
jgi:hypothetical protein